MPCSHTSLCKATGKFAGNEAVAKLVRTTVPEPLFHPLSGIKGASDLHREGQAVLSERSSYLF